MKGVAAFAVLFVSVLVFKRTAAYPQPGDNSKNDQHISCADGLEYLHDSICCVNCPAGTYLKSPCTKAGEKGKCEECDFGTYTEYPNHLPQCLTCRQCRLDLDQKVVRRCTHNHNTECQCKPGTFCRPDDVCELCNKCTRCKNDEVIVRNCTSTSNTECKKTQPVSGSGNVVFGVLGLVAAVFILVVAMVTVKKCRTDSQSSLPSGRKDKVAGSSASTEDAHAMLCESLGSSASNSQHNLTILQSPPLLFQQPPTSMVPMEPTRREHEPFPTLAPVDGEESLKRCFGFFEKLDVDQHKRFFRHLGLNDNVIKSKESLLYEDRIHELLNVWVEREGRRASLNDLLETLLNLDQRRTAEEIKNAAIDCGYYKCEC
ncbi:hematopoietic death receptor [Xenentodon cancila]